MVRLVFPSWHPVGEEVHGKMELKQICSYDTQGTLAIRGIAVAGKYFELLLMVSYEEKM